MYVIVHDKYLPDIKLDTYLGLVLATQFYFCYSFLFTNLNVYVLWFNFILGSIFVFLCFCAWSCMIMSIKQRKVKIEPRIQLNHNICTYMYE